MKNTHRIPPVTKLTSFFLLLMLSVSVVGCGNLGSSRSNEEALESLREAGSDFSQIHPFDFYLYHADEEGAESICNDLSAQGFQSTVREGALAGEWLCLASFRMLPTIENLTQIERLFEEVTGVHGGEYDGWETIIISN